MCSLRFENNFLTDGCVCFASQIIFFLANVLAYEKNKTFSQLELFLHDFTEQYRIVSVIYGISRQCRSGLTHKITLCTERSFQSTSEFRTVFTWKYLQPLFSANYVEKDQKVYYLPINYTDILLKMKTCTLKADDNFHEICEGWRRTSAPDWPKT